MANAKQSYLKQKKRIAVVLAVFVVVLCLLIVRTAWLQIVDGQELSQAATEQQTNDNTINAKRGLIYDRNFKVLASNLSVETISIAPSNLRKSAEKNKLSLDTIAAKFAEILNLEQGDVKKKLEKNSNFEYIKKKVEKEPADLLRAYLEETKLDGVAFVEDTKRYYPYNNFASHIIGFVGSDNQGLEGIESVYDNELKGTPGRVISANKPAGMEMPEDYKNYVEAQDGASVVLTIDEVVQHFAEKHLENARIENNLQEGAACIVMDVKTGEILAMATKPDYDLNAPFEVTAAVEAKSPGIKEKLASLNGAEYNAELTKALQPIRRNKAVVDSYEPGSTFKVAVASIALENSAVRLNDHFFCSGAIKVANRTISCANKNGHQAETFVQGVQNSCNPVFIEVGARIGQQRMIDGMKTFGFFDKTGIELPGETTGLFFPAGAFNEVELATTSFGQGFTVTPLQMITAVSAVANGGKMMKPHLVKQLVGKDNSVVKDIQPEFVRQVISKETSETMCEILESVVSQGGGKNAYLAGYRIAGKTGTSEKQPRGNQKYIASFIGFAPADDPQVACLVILDQPPVGATYYGGMIAAPVVKNILEETLQYIGVEPEYTQEELALVDITVPDITGKNRADAKAELAAAGINIKFNGDGDVVTDQIPKAYSKLAKDSTVVAYTEGADAKRTVTIPRVVGLTAAEANKRITDAGLNVRIKGLAGGTGQAVCSGQSPADGNAVEPGTIVTLDFSYLELRD